MMTRASVCSGRGGIMGNSPVTPAQKAADSTDRAKALAKALYDVLIGQGFSGADAQKTSQNALGEFLTQSGATKDTVDTFMTVASDLLSAMFTIISAFRHEVTHTFDSTAVEVVNEFLGTSLDPSIMATGKGGDETIQKANAIGKAVLSRLEQEFTGNA